MELNNSGSKVSSYSRKQKSLGLLCTNFLSMYDNQGVESVGLDEAAMRLGVERRRIYDIVNVLESIGVLARKGKNQYTWKGYEGIPKALTLLKEEGLRENFDTFDVKNTYGKALSDEHDEALSSPNTGSQNSVSSSSSSKSDTRKEKSLGILTQNFVKLFLCSKADLISLDEAARILLGDGQNANIMRDHSATKVRRLYDIANVLTSMNLLGKVQHPEHRKPTYRWLGVRQEYKKPANDTGLTEHKRTFGADITNTVLKRNKVDKFSNENLNQTKKMQTKKLMKHESVESEDSPCNSEQDIKQNSTGYQFGPFAPVNIAAIVTSQNQVDRFHDWENLVTVYRPQYHNQVQKVKITIKPSILQLIHTVMQPFGRPFRSLLRSVEVMVF